MERRFRGNSNTFVRSPDADLVAAWALRACFDLAVGVIFISINLFDDQEGEYGENMRMGLSEYEGFYRK